MSKEARLRKAWGDFARLATDGEFTVVLPKTVTGDIAITTTAKGRAADADVPAKPKPAAKAADAKAKTETADV